MEREFRVYNLADWMEVLGVEVAIVHGNGTRYWIVPKCKRWLKPLWLGLEALAHSSFAGGVGNVSANQLILRWLERSQANTDE